MTITYFIDDYSGDVDNVAKPLLDALNKLVYVDDAQVFDLVCRKRDLKEDLQILAPPPDLVEFLGKPEQFLHISVVNALNLVVAF